jgi:hypothetical protein
LVGRKSYEKARAAYVDMPEPSTELNDFAADLQKDIARERRDAARLAKQHKPDPERAAKSDAFCESLMASGRCEDAGEWLRSPKNTLGERNSRSSRQLVDGLLRQGCRRVLACEIDEDVDGRGNTGHVVIELPQDAPSRHEVFKTLRRLARQQGFSGDADDGQRLAYVKLD